MFKINPDRYHGLKRKRNFFEGWYFKIVDKEEKNVLAFIPGIIKSNFKEEGHAFIQVLNGLKKTNDYIKFAINDFSADSKMFSVVVGKNHFSLNEIRLNYYEKDIHILGTLKFVDIIRWPDSILNPGSMGFYNYLSFMECYSQVCCLDGSIIGKIFINNEEIDFTGGKVYIEKNWGKSFPHSYIWIQSNNFKGDQNVSLTCSIGRIPFLFSSFSGFLTAIVVDKQVYKFTTINKSKMKLIIKENNVKLTFIKDDYELNIETICSKDDFINCKGPNMGKMSVNVLESLTGIVKVELIDLHKERMIFEGIGRATGIELMGNIGELLRK